jgi:hypothetical protein
MTCGGNHNQHDEAKGQRNADVTQSARNIIDNDCAASGRDQRERTEHFGNRASQQVWLFHEKSHLALCCRYSLR